MRILYAVTAAGFGGATLHVLQLMEHMVKRGHAVALVSAPEPRLTQKARRLGARIFPNPHFVRPLSPWKDIRAIGPVFKAILEFQPDLVSAHSTKAGLAARLACILLRKPVIFTAHGWAFSEGRSLWKRKLLAMAERLAARATTKIICVSEYDRDLSLQWKVAKPEQLVVIHNGVDPQPFLEADGTAIREELKLKGKHVLSFVGRLVPQKDHFTLLEAVMSLRDGIVLLVIGDGELRPQVEQYIQERNLERKVQLLGERERDNIARILAASDLFVLSSRWEGLPRSIIEAMMSGLPVVATRVGGVPELVEDGITGFLVPSGDPKALAKAIQKLLDDPELRKRMGQAGREKALKEFTLDRMLAETQRVYEEIMSRR